MRAAPTELLWGINRACIQQSGEQEEVGTSPVREQQGFSQKDFQEKAASNGFNC